ncbi:hypothetical protein Ddye_002518, partial [Dipteronia dyeriana]
SVLSYTIGCATAKTLWDTLKKRFAAITRSHILQLKGQLQTLKKAPLDDIDVIAHTFRGLPLEYDSFGTSIRIRTKPINLDALHGLLINEEIEL